MYPCVAVKESDQKGEDVEEKNLDKHGSGGLWKGKKVFLSINRFEKKKNIELALRAFACLTAKDRQNARLVVAGKPEQVIGIMFSAKYVRRL